MADKDDEEKKGDEKKGGKGKLIIMLLPTLLLVAGAGWFFLLRGPASTAIVIPKPTAGAVTTLDPITINLAGGHFLKLGLSLQESKAVAEDVSGAKALDSAIALFSNKTMDELTTLEGRQKAKEKLVDHLREVYEGEVYDVYFTEFVMQ